MSCTRVALQECQKVFYGGTLIFLLEPLAVPIEKKVESTSRMRR